MLHILSPDITQMQIHIINMKYAFWQEFFIGLFLRHKKPFCSLSKHTEGLCWSVPGPFWEPGTQAVLQWLPACTAGGLPWGGSVWDPVSSFPHSICWHCCHIGHLLTSLDVPPPELMLPWLASKCLLLKKLALFHFYYVLESLPWNYTHFV